MAFALVALGCGKGEGEGAGGGDSGEDFGGPADDGGAGGSCVLDEDCPGRGEYCDTATNTCRLDDTIPDSTGDPGAPDFPTMVVPFFRGQLCTIMDVQAGARIPFSVSPCLHPCLATHSPAFRYFPECSGSTCDAWIVFWAEASGQGCPADVFGRFDPGECVYEHATDARFMELVRDDGTPVIADMLIEVPYLSNDDIAAIAGGADDPMSLHERISQYAQAPGRVVGPISLASGHPEPPEACADSPSCECFDVGF